MGERQALVIGPQCDGLPNLPLPFLPVLAASLFEVLIDPERDGCFTRILHTLLGDRLADLYSDYLLADPLAARIAKAWSLPSGTTAQPPRSPRAWRVAA